MSTAKNTLQELSSDPVTQRLARERETEVLMHRLLINSAIEHGREEGLIVAVRALCDLLDIEIDIAREQRLTSLTSEQLAKVVEQLKTERRWPEGT